MMRPPFVGHRRYSITHRAVQRLRELVPGRDEEDDESLRDKLDEALGEAEDTGKAIRTLDAMLGEPQTLIPVDTFGDVLYAIIKEDTVVTVLPRGHGEEILQRGQAMEQRVAAGQVTVRPHERDRDKERWSDGPRRRWQKDSQSPVVIERIVRGGNGNGASAPAGGNGVHETPPPDPDPPSHDPDPDPTEPAEAHNDPSALVVRLPERPTMGPVAQTLHNALEQGRRRAAVLALREALASGDRDDRLLPLWNALAEHGLPQSLTVGDLLEAVENLP